MQHPKKEGRDSAGSSLARHGGHDPLQRATEMKTSPDQQLPACPVILILT